nr:MAG TPA: hypothetical protein [Caudoviricetes sp.]
MTFWSFSRLQFWLGRLCCSDCADWHNHRAAFECVS